MDDHSHDGAEEIALFRFSVISEAVSGALTPAQRGMIVRALAARTWRTPEGVERSFTRGTIDRWLVAYRRDGLAGLRPTPRADRGRARSQARWLEEACRMRRALPTRSAAQIADAIFRAHGVVLSERTVRAHLRRAGLTRQALTSEPARPFGRFEASRANEIWIGDVLHGPFVPHPRVAGSRRAKLFVLVDDHSRLLVHGRWMTEENTRAGQDVLRSAIARRGLPENLYVDNGAPYANHQLARACAVLGIHLVHSRPGMPQGRGKQERLNSYIRQAFVAEMEDRGIATFEELNDFFMAWAEQVANARTHAETRQAPIERFLQGYTPSIPPPAVLAEAFRWSVVRRVTKTATISLFANRYQVDPALIGRAAELRFDPEDLTTIDVYDHGVPAGVAVPFVIGRHVHPAVPQAAPATPPEDTGPGIDYLGLVAAAHAEALGEGAIAYREVHLPGFEHLDDDTGPDDTGADDGDETDDAAEAAR
ncbi:MAG: DDE-type integrase/transposase/recombinase [Acidimicrobiales bacterium]